MRHLFVFGSLFIPSKLGGALLVGELLKWLERENAPVYRGYLIALTMFATCNLISVGVSGMHYEGTHIGTSTLLDYYGT